MSPASDVFTVPIPITERGVVDEWLQGQQKPIVVGEDVAPTMLPTWNKASRDEGGGLGIAKGWHVIIAGNTGSGKSVFALNTAAAAMKEGMTVGFVSLEMSVTQLETRFYSIWTGDPIRKLERGKEFDPDQARRTAVKVHELSEETGGHFVVNQDQGVPLRNIDEILHEMDEWITRFGCDVFVIDYMQLVGDGDSTEIASEAMRVSRAVMGFAQSRGVITLGISQFNRSTSRDYDNKPIIQGLFGSSGMENDAHQIVMLDHSRYRDGGDAALTWALVGKNRHGMEPEIPIRMDKTNLRIREALPDEEHEWPGVGL